MRGFGGLMSIDVVSGGAGFIGSHLVERLLDEGSTVKVIDNLSVGRLTNLEHLRENSRLEFVQGDVSNLEACRAVCDGVERVFHLAARADIVPSIQDPEVYFRANVDGTFAMLQAAHEHAVDRFVYVASSSSYGIPDVYPTPEDTPADPQYPYALTKYLGEQLVTHWAKVYGMSSVSVRFFNVYGPRARTSGTYGAVFGVFLAQLLAGEPLTVVGDGEQVRDFTFVSDAVDALVAAAGSPVSGVCLNVGSGKPVSVNQLVKLLGAKDVVHIPKRPGEPDCTFADTSRIEELLGWHAKVPFEEGVKIMLDNIDYWREAPVWTADKIADATADWFKYLGAT